MIDAARHIQEAVECLERIEQASTLGVSFVTEMELLIGCQNKTEQRNAERFLERFQILKLDEKACDVTVELLRRYRLSHGLLISDALIAATAIATGHPLITKNQRDFRFIEGLELLSYPVGSND